MKTTNIQLSKIMTAATFILFNIGNASACISMPTPIKVSGSTFENNQIRVSNRSGEARIDIDDDKIIFDSQASCWRATSVTANKKDECISKNERIILKDESGKTTGKYYVDPKYPGKIVFYSVMPNGKDRDFQKPSLVIEATSTMDKSMRFNPETQKMQPNNSIRTDLELRGEVGGKTIGVYNSSSSNEDMVYRSMGMGGAPSAFDLNGKRYVGSGGCGGLVKEEAYTSGSSSSEAGRPDIFIKSQPVLK